MAVKRPGQRVLCLIGSELSPQVSGSTAILDPTCMSTIPIVDNIHDGARLRGLDWGLYSPPKDTLEHKSAAPQHKIFMELKGRFYYGYIKDSYIG